MPKKMPAKLSQKAVVANKIERPAYDNFSLAGITPRIIAGILHDLNNIQGTRDYFSLAFQLEQRDPTYRSLLATRKLAVAHLPFVVEAHSDKLKDQKVADFVRRQLKRGGVIHSSIVSMLDALGKGVSFHELIWGFNSEGEFVPVDIIWRDPRWFNVDSNDGETFRLIKKISQDEIVDGGEDLQPYKWVVHAPKLICGLAINTGLATTASWLFVVKGLTTKAWLSAVEVFGQPFVIGKYGNSATEEEINAFKNMIAAISAETRGVMPESVDLQILDNKVQTNAPFEPLVRYCDEMLSRLVLGQTLTSSNDGGGSNALGKVHDGVRVDLIRADAAALCHTITQQIIKPMVEMNFGMNYECPAIRLPLEERADIAALTQALSMLVPMGLEVPQSFVRDKLGIPDPQPEEKLLKSSDVVAQMPASGEGKDNENPDRQFETAEDA